MLDLKFLKGGISFVYYYEYLKKGHQSYMPILIDFSTFVYLIFTNMVISSHIILYQSHHKNMPHLSSLNLLILFFLGNMRIVQSCLSQVIFAVLLISCHIVIKNTNAISMLKNDDIQLVL